MPAPDWYSVIEPRRMAQISLTEGGLEGDDPDALDHPPEPGKEESWLTLQLRRLRELAAKASAKAGEVKGNAKKRLQGAVADIKKSAGNAKRKVLELFPDKEDLKEGFQKLVSWSQKLQFALGVSEALALAALLWLGSEFLDSPYGRRLF